MRFILVVFGLVGIVYGSQALYVKVTNLSPTTFTFAEYQATHPSKKWLQLTECRVNLLQASYFSSEGEDNIRSLYVPVYSTSPESDSKIHVLLHTRDPSMISMLIHLNSLEDESATLAYLLGNREKLEAERDLTGLVRFGMDQDSDTLDQIKASKLDLCPNFVILNEDEKPTWGMVGFLPAGLISILVFVASVRSKPPPPLPRRNPIKLMADTNPPRKGSL